MQALFANTHFYCCTPGLPPPTPTCHLALTIAFKATQWFQQGGLGEKETQHFSGYPVSPLPFSLVMVQYTHLRALECLTSDLQGDWQLLQLISAAHSSSPCCTNKPIPDTQGRVEGGGGLCQQARETRGHQARTLFNCCPGKERAPGLPCSAQVLSTL